MGNEGTDSQAVACDFIRCMFCDRVMSEGNASGAARRVEPDTDTLTRIPAAYADASGNGAGSVCDSQLWASERSPT